MIYESKGLDGDTCTCMYWFRHSTLTRNKLQIVEKIFVSPVPWYMYEHLFIAIDILFYNITLQNYRFTPNHHNKKVILK